MDDVGGFTPELNSNTYQGNPDKLQDFQGYANHAHQARDLMDMSMGMSEGMEMNTASLPSKELPHVVLQNGGYGNIVYNLMFLLQIRVTKYFHGGKLIFSHLLKTFFHKNRGFQ